MKRAISYRRASTNESNQANSLAVQEAVIDRFASAYGYEIESSFCEYASGRNDEREQFNLALAYAVENDCFLIMWKIDRCARSMTIYNRIAKHLHRIRFCEIGDSEPQLMVLAVLLAAAENESVNTSVRVRTAMAHIKANDPSVRFGNPRIMETAYPLGLKVRQTNAKQFNDSILKLVQDLESAGHSDLRSICVRMNELGISTRRGKPWTYSNLYRISQRRTPNV